MWSTGGNFFAHPISSYISPCRSFHLWQFRWRLVNSNQQNIFPSRTIHAHKNSSQNCWYSSWVNTGSLTLWGSSVKAAVRFPVTKSMRGFSHVFIDVIRQRLLLYLRPLSIGAVVVVQAVERWLSVRAGRVRIPEAPRVRILSGKENWF